MKKISCACALLAAFCNLHAYGQNNNSVTNNAVAGLKSLSGNHIIEKAYLHFDKPYYEAGDTMRFKAYVTLGEHYDLSKLSGILHVDLIRPGNVIVRSIKLQIVNGIGWGDFPLAFALNAGNYRVRAYTNYMQNAPEYFFDKTIAIGSAMNTGPTAGALSEQKSRADLQFFPEGGELAGAMVSKVAFKAIGVNGLGINVKGIVVDNTNSQVAAFSSSHLGMGAFYLQPEEGKTYKAKVSFADGSQGTFGLPAIQSKGIALAVKDTLGKLSIEIRSNKAYFQENLNKNINLVIYGSGFVNTVNTKLDSRRLSMDIPNSQFPSGVVQVTLFSQTGEPLSERLVFLKNSDLIDFTLTSDKNSYSKREKVSVSVAAKDKGNAAQGHFSVAVIDESKVPVDENSETTILTYLLLSSQLRGYIEQPNYYFIQNNDQTTNDLDALMLTQGYRRFLWKKLLNDRDSTFAFAPEKNLEISGTAKTSAGVPVKDLDVMLLTADRRSTLGERTDNNGRFKFANLPPMADSTMLVLQATGSTKVKNSTAFTIDADKPGPAVMEEKEPVSQDDLNKAMSFSDNNKPVMEANVTKNVSYKYNSKTDTRSKTAVLNDKNNYESSNLGGSGHADQVVSGDRIKNAPNLSTGLNGLLHGVSFTNGVPYNLVSNILSSSGAPVTEPMYVVLDGNPLEPGQSIDNINPLSVATVEMLSGANAAIYGLQGGAGVLVITSRKTAADVGGTSSATLGTLSFRIQGFYVGRQFYSPKYDIKIAGNKPDRRSTILWLPELTTDKDGSASFEYYNSDGKGSYRIVMEGIDDKGNIGRQVYRYKVE